MKTANFTLKTNPAKYANLHKCDIAYWPFSCDFSQKQDADTLKAAVTDTAARLTAILKADAFKPENVDAAKELGKIVMEQSKALFADGADMAVSTFIVYQLQRYAFRIWYRDTKVARDAAKALLPAKQDKADKPAKQAKPEAGPTAVKPEDKKPAKQAKTTKAKAPAKQETAKANEATFVSKLTKAQKKELLLTLMAELLK